MANELNNAISYIRKFKVEIVIGILLFYLIASLAMRLQAIFISCLIILIIIAFRNYVVQALSYFKSIEAGTQGIKFVLNPDEIRKAIAESNFPDKVKEQLSKPENVDEMKYFLYDIYRLINPRERSLDEILNVVSKRQRKKPSEK